MKKKFMSIFALILALCLVMTGCASGTAPTESAPAEAPAQDAPAAEAEVVYGFEKGMTMEDFSFTTFDGKTMSLYEVLEEKDMVLINFWASWCGPCRMEFPYMEQAYQMYKDDVEIIALSSEPSDSNDVLAAFVEEMGMSFPVGRDEQNIYSKLGYYSIPVSIVVDRFGTICFSEPGSMPSLSSFKSLFEAFIGDDYTESVVYDSIPAPRPDYDPLSADELAAVLNVEGGELAFENVEGEIEWPFIKEEIDGREVLRSGNAGIDNSASSVLFSVSAQAGDALAVNFKTSSQPAGDLLQIVVNDELVKTFGGEHDWMQYAYSFEEAGEYDIMLCYMKDYTAAEGEDCAWIDSVQLLSGAEAEAAVKANPVYPVADEFSISIISDDYREIIFNDPLELLSFGKDFTYYNSDSNEFKLKLTLPADIDPEAVYVYDALQGSTPVLDYMTEDGYVFTNSTADLISKYESPINVLRCESIYYQLPNQPFLFLVNGNEFDSFINEFIVDSKGEPFVKWAYADEVDAEAFYAEKIEADFSELGFTGEASYNVYVADPDGQPVPGVMLQVCDAETCMVYTTDENGVCTFTLPPYPYELHVLKVPEGFQADSTLYELPFTGGDSQIILNKN